MDVCLPPQREVDPVRHESGGTEMSERLDLGE